MEKNIIIKNLILKLIKIIIYKYIKSILYIK